MQLNSTVPIPAGANTVPIRPRRLSSHAWLRLCGHRLCTFGAPRDPEYCAYKPPVYECDHFDCIAYSDGKLIHGAWHHKCLQAAALPASASPIEQQFWEAYERLRLPELDGLIPQYKAGPYRMDFALPDPGIGIELEGLRDHSKTGDIARDCLRQRWLQWLGWRIIRIGGSEVYRDAEYCVRMVAAFAEKWSAS